MTGEKSSLPSKTENEKSSLPSKTENEKSSLKKKSENYLKVVFPKTQIAQKILKILQVCELDPFRRPSDISEGRELTRALNGLWDKCEQKHIYEEILTYIKEVGLGSFDDFLSLTKSYKDQINKVLKYLENELKIIESKDNRDDDVAFYNEVLGYYKIRKKTKVYVLTNNHRFKLFLSDIDNDLSPEKKEQIEKIKEDWSQKTNGYLRHLQAQAKIKLEKTRKPKTTLEKIRDVLSVYEGEELTYKQIIYILHFSKGIIGLNGWKGRCSSRYGEYSTFSWENFMLEQGFIISSNKGKGYIITKTMNRFTEIKENEKEKKETLG